MKKNPKISLLLFSLVAVLNGTGFSSGLVGESSNDLHGVMLYHDPEKSNFSSEFELSTKGAEKPRTNTSRNLGIFINLPLLYVGKCLVRLECPAGADTKDEAKDFADVGTFILQGICGPAEPKTKRGTDGIGKTNLQTK